MVPIETRLEGNGISDSLTGLRMCQDFTAPAIAGFFCVLDLLPGLRSEAAYTTHLLTFCYRFCATYSESQGTYMSGDRFRVRVCRYIPGNAADTNIADLTRVAALQLRQPIPTECNALHL